jgi:phage shock protein A
MAVSNELANKHNKLIAVEKLTSQIEQLQLQIRTFMSEHEEMMRAHGELRDGLSFDSVINLERKVQELQAQYQECQTEKEQLEGRLHSTSESLARQESTLSEIRGEIGSAQMAARLNKVEEYLGKSVEDASDAMSVLQAFSSLSEDAPKLFDIERTGLFLEFNSILVQEFARAASLAASGEDPRSSLHFRNRTATSEFDVPTNNAVIASRDVINNSFEALKEKYGTDE